MIIYIFITCIGLPSILLQKDNFLFNWCKLLSISCTWVIVIWVANISGVLFLGKPKRYFRTTKNAKKYTTSKNSIISALIILHWSFAIINPFWNGYLENAVNVAIEKGCFSTLKIKLLYIENTTTISTLY